MLTSGVGDDDVASVDPGQIGKQCAERARINRGRSLKSFRSGAKNDRDCGQFRTPGDRL